VNERVSNRASIAVLVVHPGSLAASNVADFVAGADEVIEVSPTCKPLLRDLVTAGTKYRYVFASQTGLAHSLNLGASFASSDWIAITYDDEPLVSCWLNKLRSLLEEPNSPCIHLFHSEAGLEIPLVVLKRMALVYGHFDETFACGRLAAVHWAFRIFPRPVCRILPNEGVAHHICDFIESRSFPPRVEAPLAGLVNLWYHLRPALRRALLEKTINDPEATKKTLLDLLNGVKNDSTAAPDPYRSGSSYDPKPFWESNTVGFIRWEVYQPDEPEILTMLDKIRAASALELGCGAGRNVRYFARAERYTGIDFSMNLLRRAIERQEPNSLGILCGDITALPYADASFGLVFSDSTLQHITPQKISESVAEILRVSSEYICVIEYTEEEREGGDWFKQIHMFAHDYRKLFGTDCELLWHTDTSLRVHPARKEAFLFRKRK
jgi:SAM-dependent methyltransferase